MIEFEEPSKESRKPRRSLRRSWPWMAGLIAAVTISGGVGAVVGYSQVPAAESPKVRAALQDLAEVRTSESERVAERERIIGEQSDALDVLESEVDEREGKLDQRKATLDKRSDKLDKRSAALDKREKSIKSQERTIAANTVPGDGVFVVGDDIKAGTYRTSGPSAGGIGSCYYAFLKGTGADADIIDNNITEGQATVTLSAGQVFETTSCSDWKRQ